MKLLIMNDKNIIQPCATPPDTHVTNGKDINRRGRPTVEKMIKFGPQPKSIIAQMFSEMKTKSNNVNEDEPVNQCDQPQVFIEINEVEDYVCQTCSFRTNSVKKHKKHLTTHQQFNCDYPDCSYSCKLSSNLIKHKRVHTNEKPYLCDRCSFRSNFVNSLKTHKRIHTAERPYQCKHCNYKCNSSSNLKKHTHLKHPEGPSCT